MYIVLLQALSKALTELRADMVTQAQEQVKTHAEDSSQQINVQNLMDKIWYLTITGSEQGSDRTEGWHGNSGPGTGEDSCWRFLSTDQCSEPHG